MAEIAENLADVNARISAVCRKAGRGRGEVELIAVSKTFPVEAVSAAFDAGHLNFGESKLQEAESKIVELPSTVRWHFIGRVQRNKVRKLLPSFDVIHAIDSLRLAGYVDRVARELGLSAKIFLQVNIAGEPSKGGFSPEEIQTEFGELIKLESLQIQGLMCIPPAGDAESSRSWFAELRELRDNLQHQSGIALPALSMGMSTDYEVAIEEGATHVRVGSAIFGNRSYRVDGELG